VQHEWLTNVFLCPGLFLPPPSVLFLPFSSVLSVSTPHLSLYFSLPQFILLVPFPSFFSCYQEVELLNGQIDGDEAREELVSMTQLALSSALEQEVRTYSDETELK
jgi:hypothetical protein